MFRDCSFLFAIVTSIRRESGDVTFRIAQAVVFRGLGNGNTEAIGQFFAPDTLAEGLIPEMQVGADDFRDLVTAFRHILGDIKVDLPKIIEDGDWVSAIVHLQTTRADNGAPLQASGSVIARIKDGYMVEAYNQFDFISFFEQLGQFPEDTLPVCMTGQRLDWA